MSDSIVSNDGGFNAELLKLLRRELEWTQETLAHRADLSVRVIAKAEKGEAVSAATVKALAEAFRSAGKSVEPADFTVNPAKLARCFLKNYARYQADCVQHSLDIIAPEIVAYVDGDPAVNPIAGTYHGLEAFDGLWRKFFSIFDRAGGTLGDDPSIQCVGNEVLAWGHEDIHLIGVPSKWPGFVMTKFQFAGGKIVRFEDYYDATGMMFSLNHYAERFPDAPWAKILRDAPIRLPPVAGDRSDS